MISKDKPTAHLFFANRAAIADATAAAAADAVVFYFFFASLFYHYFDLWKLRAPWLRRVFVSRLLPSPARCRHHWNDRFNFYFIFNLLDAIFMFVFDDSFVSVQIAHRHMRNATTRPRSNDGQHQQATTFDSRICWWDNRQHMQVEVRIASN